MSTPIFCARQWWGICVLVSALLALSVSIASAAEVKSITLKDSNREFPSPARKSRWVKYHLLRACHQSGGW